MNTTRRSAVHVGIAGVLFGSVAFGCCATASATASARSIQPVVGTSFDRLVRENSGAENLPPGDGDDPIALPAWFRSYLRTQLPGLPTGGRPQYPRGALAVWLWLDGNRSFPAGVLSARIDALKAAIPAVVGEHDRRAAYPKEWEVDVPNGTRLAALRQKLDEEFARLPARDLEDRSPLPIWFRVYLRQYGETGATSGSYQYNRNAPRSLQWLLGHPNSDEIPADR